MLSLRWAQAPSSGCDFAGQGKQRPGMCRCLLPAPHHFPEGHFFIWGPSSSLFLSSPPWLSWQKPGQVAPGWKALFCLCTFCWVGGAGSGPGSAAWRAGSEPTRHQDGGKEDLRCRIEGQASWTAQGWEGDKTKVTWLSRWQNPNQSHRVRWEQRAGGLPQVSPQELAGDLGHKRFPETWVQIRVVQRGCDGQCPWEMPYVKEF